jgi:PRTRC genetic system protein B
MFTRQYRLAKALMIYELQPDQYQDSDPYGQPKTPRYYIEAHDIIRTRGGQPQLAAGKALTTRTIKALAQSLLKDHLFPREGLGLLPERVLAYSPVTNGLAWWRPAGPQRLLFHSGLNIPSAVYPCPALLFSQKNSTLSVYALKGNQRPTAETPLCAAPFFNVFNTHNVCMGNVRLPDANIPVAQRIEAWENAFFNSEFTHTVAGAAPLKKLTLEQLWPSLAGKSKFPVSHLKPIKHQGTVKEILAMGGFL